MDSDELKDMIFGVAQAQAASARAGLEAGARSTELRFLPAIKTLDYAYRRAATDPETKLPSYLTAAIFNVLALQGPVAAKREPSSRDDDLSPAGGTLRPGQ